MIFRLDQGEIEIALKAAVARGVFVHALIAHTNREGGKTLRKLELRLLESGVNVARTADDLVRYHDKMMVIDRKVLYLLAFNYTYLDIYHSRSFGIVTRERPFVQEAVKLFEADTKRQNYTAGLDTFVVSPVNARKQLSAFIRRARKQLLIYDSQLTDGQMIRILHGRSKAGVEVRIIGRVGKLGASLTARELHGMELHTRTIIRDVHQAFIGSQSLRKLQLDERREVGIIVRDPKVVKRLLTTFETDWASAEVHKEKTSKDDTAAPTPRLPILKEAIREVVKEVVKEVVAQTGDQAANPEEMKEAIEEVVTDAVKEAVKEKKPDA